MRRRMLVPLALIGCWRSCLPPFDSLGTRIREFKRRESPEENLRPYLGHSLPRHTPLRYRTGCVGGTVCHVAGTSQEDQPPGRQYPASRLRAPRPDTGRLPLHGSIPPGRREEDSHHVLLRGIAHDRSRRGACTPVRRWKHSVPTMLGLRF